MTLTGQFSTQGMVMQMVLAPPALMFPPPGQERSKLAATTWLPSGLAGTGMLETLILKVQFEFGSVIRVKFANGANETDRDAEGLAREDSNNLMSEVEARGKSAAVPIHVESSQREGRVSFLLVSQPTGWVAFWATVAAAKKMEYN